MPLENLTRERIIEALNALGRKAENENVTLELCIYGGSAMMLAYGARETTKDVDAIFKPSETAQRLAKAVAAELGLHEQWLNDDVRRFISASGTFTPLQIQELEESARHHLKITRPSANYLLAMKCMACRAALPGYRGDLDDIAFLVRKMGIHNLQQVEECLSKFYPFDVLTGEARDLIGGVLPGEAANPG